MSVFGKTLFAVCNLGDALTDSVDQAAKKFRTRLKKMNLVFCIETAMFIWHIPKALLIV
jgi:hypothetical protein